MATRVILGSIGDVASITVWAQTELETAVGGDPSSATIVIRDVGITRAQFIIGSRITVDRGPGTDPIWTGYLIRPSRRFWFPVDRPDTLQRQWVLHCVDINVLWGRRVVFDVSSPANITGPKFTSDTWDDDALTELFANWVDLSADDLDLTTRVNRVGLINYDQTTYPWNAGQTMGEAVRTIAQLPAAVYGIDSLRRVVYADVDDENAPFVLSDQYVSSGWEPVGSPGLPIVGYREMTLVPDGTKLANDAMAWGFGMGAPSGVFKRLEDAASIALHGLWQEAVTLYSVYKQATINKVADSIVNGSPGSKRGRKDDKISVECVIHRDGLHVGDRVRFISHIWQFEDVLPVRKMKITFPTPTDVRYQLLLSHDIDVWGFQDPLPPFSIPGPYPILIPDFIIDSPPPVFPPPTCVETVFQHDDLTRTKASVSGPFAIGTSIWGSPWVNWREISGPLEYPGEDVVRPDNPASGYHLNKVSPMIPDNSSVRLTFVEHDGNGDPIDAIGVIGLGLNAARALDYVAPVTFSTAPASTNNNHVYYWFGDGGSAGHYNPNLTGEGYYSYTPPTMGNASCSAVISGGIASMTVVSDTVGVRIPFTASATFNRDVINNTFRFRPSVLSDDVVITFVYGAAKVELIPDTTAGEVRVITGSGESALPFLDWVANEWYTCEIALDLLSNSVRVRVAREGSATTEISRATNGERANDGGYQPFVGISVTNTAATPFTLGITAVRAASYADGTSETGLFGGGSGSGGWGDPWVVYTNTSTPGVDTGVEYGADGSIEVVDAGEFDFGHIQRAIEGGAADIGFSISNYAPSSSFVLGVHFGVWRNTSTGVYFKRNTIQFGNSTNVSVARSDGSISTSMNASGTWFTGGGPVNVRIQIGGGGIRVKLWPGGEDQPEAWTLENLPTDMALLPLIFGLQLQWGSLGNRVTLGSWQLAAGEQDDYIAAGPYSMKASGPSTFGTGNLTGLGRYHEWPFPPPADFAEYPAPFDSLVDVQLAQTVSTPQTLGRMAWRVFPPQGDGLMYEYIQYVAAIRVGVLAENYPWGGKVIIRGEVGLRIVGTGSHLADRISPIVAFKNFNYGFDSSPTPPTHHEYSMDGTDEQYIQFLNVLGQAENTQWLPMNVAFPLSQINPATGEYALMWGVEIFDLPAILSAAGPWQHTVWVSVLFRNLVMEFVPNTADPFLIGSPHSDPCPPYPVGYDGYDFGVPIKGRTCVNFTGDGSTASFDVTEGTFEPGSADVIVDGYTLTPGEDFTENVDRQGVTLSPAPAEGLWVLICCTVE